jgi:chromosome segregation ATPase
MKADAASFHPTQQYCGVCHGALTVNLLEGSRKKDSRLNSCSSAEGFPLPSAASAVGTVHPCGHLFHVSCFHNHNNKHHRSETRSTREKMNSLVEILHSGVSIELKSFDEAEGDACQRGKECPLCRNRASLFVELSSSTIHNLNHNYPLQDATNTMALNPSDTDDDADTDIMNYYSFTSLGEYEDNLFIDTSDVVGMTAMQGGRVTTQHHQTMMYTQDSTEYHDVRNINNKFSTMSGDTLETNTMLDDHKPAMESDGNIYPYMIPVDGLSTPKLQCFDSRTTHTTPSIMVTPGSIARRKVNKKVRFFDDHFGTIPSLQSTSIDNGAAELALQTTIALADKSDDRDDTDEEEISSVEEVEFRDDFVEVMDGKGGAPAADDDSDDGNHVTDHDSVNIPLASMTDDSHEDMLDLADVPVLPNSDSKLILWNVSTYDEDGKDNKGEIAITYELRKEIDSLRTQLIKLELEKEEQLQLIGNFTKAKELGVVADQTIQLKKVTKENEELKKQLKLSHQEIISTEEELAATQIQVETAADDHQQAQAKLQRQLEKAQEELEEVKYRLETFEQQAEEQAKAAVSEKEAIEINHDQTQQAMTEHYEEEVANLQRELDETKKTSNDIISRLETCQNEVDDAWEEAEDAQAELETCQKDLDDVRKELEHTQALFKSCQLQLEEQKQWAEAEIKDLIAKQERVIVEMQQEHRSELDSKDEDYEAIREELQQTACCLIIRQNETDEQVKTMHAEKKALIEWQKQSEAKMNLDHETEIKNLKQTLGHAENEAKEIKRQLRACQEAMKQREKAFEEEKEASEDSFAELAIVQGKELASKAWLESQLEEAQRKVKESIAELTSQKRSHKDAIEALESKVKHTQEEAECSRKDLVDKLESCMQSNEELELQLQQVKRRLHVSGDELHLDLDQQREKNGELQRQLKQVNEELVKHYAHLEEKQSLQSQLKKVTEKLRGSKTELRNQLEEQRYLQAQLKQVVEENEVSETNLNSQFEEQKRLQLQLSNVTKDFEALKSKVGPQMEEQKHLLSQLDRAKEELEASKTDFNAKIEETTHLQSQLDQVNAKLLRLNQSTKQQEHNHVRALFEQAKEELEHTKEQLQGTRADLHDIQHLQTQLQQAEASNTDLGTQLNDLKSQLNQLEESKTDLIARLDVQASNAAELESQLKHTQKLLEVSNAEREEAKSIKLEETEEIMEVKRELESARTDMEKLITTMQASERELLILRTELNAAKELLASSTNALDLEQTSTSFSTVNGSIDDVSVHVLQDELRHVKQELSAKNLFIRNQLSLAKGKLVEYVRTKEVELEDTKRELAHVKQALKNKNGTFAKQIQTTEEELQELASMKETLQATMNELAEKNSVITKELEDAKDQLALLAETKRQLKGTGQALHATHLKLWSTFAVIAVFLGHYAKARFFLHKSTDTPPDMESEFAEFDFNLINTMPPLA